MKQLFFTLLVCAVVALVAFLANKLINNLQNPVDNKEDACPPHKWVPDIQNHLFCRKCKRRPGEIETNYDKPY